MEKDKKKIKKKSFINKIFSHTVKKPKKTKDELKNNAPYDALYPDASLFTYCDFCDKEVVSTFHNDVICHEKCKSQMASLKVAPPMDDATLTSPIDDSLDFFIQADVDTIKLKKEGSKLKRAPSTLQNPKERYVFSSVDLPSIRNHGFVPKLIDPPTLEKELQIDVTLPRPSSVKDDQYDDFTLDSLPMELKSYIDVFNSNDQGLLIEANTAQLMGKLRIHINLMRPITMLLTPRPPSLYDTLQSSQNPKNNNIDNYVMSKIDNNNSSQSDANQKSMFWIDRGTTTVLYLNINSTASDVISLLLRKFNIKNNPHRFALYLHIVKPNTNTQDYRRRRSKEYEEVGGEILFQKLRPCQCPLKIMLSWCEEGEEAFQEKLISRRFVLQENDNGGIDWDEFSVPELKRFLSILTGQETEKKEEISKKFELRKNEIYRLLEKSRRKQRA